MTRNKITREVEWKAGSANTAVVDPVDSPLSNSRSGIACRIPLGILKPKVRASGSETVHGVCTATLFCFQSCVFGVYAKAHMSC